MLLAMLVDWEMEALLAILGPLVLTVVVAQMRSTKRLMSVVMFFCLVNAAYIVSLVLFLTGKRAPSWKPERLP